MLYQTLITRTGGYLEQDCEAVLRDMHGHARMSSSSASHHARLRMAISRRGEGVKTPHATA